MAYYTKTSSPMGEITLLTFDGDRLAGLWLETQTAKTDGCERWDGAEIFDAARHWLERYFAGEAPASDEIALDFHGTEFQRRVWRELCRIPYGTTVSYGALACRIGCRSAQAVGQAVGKNPVSVIVPCHRVIGKNGALTGYAGGLDKKRELLKIEKIL